MAIFIYMNIWGDILIDKEKMEKLFNDLTLNNLGKDNDKEIAELYKLYIKNTFMMPINTIFSKFGFYRCPICGGIVFKCIYCKHCGQRLKPVNICKLEVKK